MLNIECNDVGNKINCSDQLLEFQNTYACVYLQLFSYVHMLLYHTGVLKYKKINNTRL